MSKKQTYGLIVTLLVILCVVIVGLVIWLKVPRAVVQDPEHTTVTSISIWRRDSAWKETKNGNIQYNLTKTEKDQETGKKVVQYLAQCTEKRTLRTNRHLAEFPADWPCILISLTEKNQERVILLGPVGADTQFYHGQVNISFNLSDGSFSDQYQGDLQDPDEIRAFVLDTLGLSEDLCTVETD